MKVGRYVFCSVGSLLWLAVIVHCVASAYYCSSFEHDRVAIDARRIPLWYPWDISEDHFEGGARMGDWRLYSTDAIGTGEKRDWQQIAVSRVIGVERFNVGTNFIYGVVGGDGETDSANANSPYSQRYFIFTDGMDEPAWFTKRENFLSCCKTKGVGEVRFKSFDENYESYFDQDDSTSSELNYWLSRCVSFGQLAAMAFIWLSGTLGLVMVVVPYRRKESKCGTMSEE